MSPARIESILLCLNSGQMDAGWAAFLETYSGVIHSVIRQFEDGGDLDDECFEFVCAKLSDNDFRRLTAFKPNGPAKFRTWLTAVAANLCIDWRRSMYGRFSAPNVIRGLPEIDQIVFDCIYHQGMTRQEYLHVLKTRFPKITDRQIIEIKANIHTVLTSKQRWRLSTTKHRSASIDGPEESIVADEKGPEALVQSEQGREQLQKAMSRLEPRQRLFLQLRYQQDLTLLEVARLMGLKDPFQARRKIDAAVSALARAMKI